MKILLLVGFVLLRMSNSCVQYIQNIFRFSEINLPADAKIIAGSVNTIAFTSNLNPFQTAFERNFSFEYAGLNLAEANVQSRLLQQSMSQLFFHKTI